MYDDEQDEAIYQEKKRREEDKLDKLNGEKDD
jgi:hypothetical protein